MTGRAAPAPLLAAVAAGVAATVAVTGACGPPEVSLEVTATAYNSVRGQTLGDPALTAWGHRLEPGMRAVAVSRDLIPLGLTNETHVRIDGLPGTYRVLDKLHRRFKKRIDIYMGEDVEAAREFGKRKVTIRWRPPEDVELPDGLR